MPTVPDRRQWTLPSALRRSADRFPDKVYLDVPGSGDRLTFADTLAAAESVGSGLLQRGHAPGDRMIVMMENRTEYILAWLGSALAGLAEVPINVAYGGTFLEHQVLTAAPAAAVASPEFASRLAHSPAARASLRGVYVVSDDQPSARAAHRELGLAGIPSASFAELLGSARQDLPVVRPHDLAAIFFTSGTTGLSKGVAMSHSHMHFFADEAVSLTRLTADDVYLSVGPLFHGNAQFLAAYPALLAGARFVLHEKFSASRWTRWMAESGATVTNLVGVMSDFLWKQPPSADDSRNQLRCVWAVPNPTAVAEEFKARFGMQELVENFGLTEVSMPILTPYGVPRPAGAAGLLVRDWFDVRLADPETDEEVQAGQVGELLVRPKVPWTTAVEYFGMPERTAEALRNCWFHTGDGLRQDEDGWYYFVDRLKDSIRRRGENISSYEVEQAMLQHPGIAECAVYAVPADEASGEDEVMAAIVRADGSEVGAREVWEAADDALPAFAVPRYLQFIDSLPRTPSDKIQKAVLRKLGVGEGTYDRASQR